MLRPHVQLLSDMLDDHPLAERLDRALAQDNAIVGLTAEDREHLIELLDANPPAGLAALRISLLRQHQNRLRKPRW